LVAVFEGDVDLTAYTRRFLPAVIRQFLATPSISWVTPQEVEERSQAQCEIRRTCFAAASGETAKNETCGDAFFCLASACCLSIPLVRS
jgi:hypothetical protein